MLHKYSGLCAAIRTASKIDNAPLLAAIHSAAHTNTSALAFEQASQPYFADALLSLLGDAVRIQTKNSVPMIRTSVPLQQFLIKISNIYALPSSTAVSLCKALISVHSLLWFVLYLLAILAWKYHPLFFVASTTVMKPAAPPAPQAATATSAAAKKNE